MSRAEPMPCFLEQRVMYRCGGHALRLQNYLCIVGSDAHGPHFAITLGVIDCANWTRAGTAFRSALDQTVEPLQRHAVEGLSVHSRRHRTPITGYSVIGPLI